MDKTLLKAYIRTIVEEEIERVLPKMLKEHFTPLTEQVSVPTAAPKASPISRNKLAEMMGLTRLGDTITASTNNVGPITNIPPDAPDYIHDVINKDYSAFMTAMNKKK